MTDHQGSSDGSAARGEKWKGEPFAAAGEDLVAAVQNALADPWRPYKKEGIVWLGASVHIFTGARPRD